eukprot:Platyproteum_vivax@DN4982_c0_g1_i2.p1
MYMRRLIVTLLFTFAHIVSFGNCRLKLNVLPQIIMGNVLSSQDDVPKTEAHSRPEFLKMKASKNASKTDNETSAQESGILAGQNSTSDGQNSIVAGNASAIVEESANESAKDRLHRLYLATPANFGSALEIDAVTGLPIGTQYSYLETFAKSTGRETPEVDTPINIQEDGYAIIALLSKQCEIYKRDKSIVAKAKQLSDQTKIKLQNMTPLISPSSLKALNFQNLKVNLERVQEVCRFNVDVLSCCKYCGCFPKKTEEEQDDIPTDVSESMVQLPQNNTTVTTNTTSALPKSNSTAMMDPPLGPQIRSKKTQKPLTVEDVYPIAGNVTTTKGDLNFKNSTYHPLMDVNVNSTSSHAEAPTNSTSRHAQMVQKIAEGNRVFRNDAIMNASDNSTS